MNETARGAGTGEIPSASTAPVMATQNSGQLQLKELQAENARLLRLVGELLVANQLLRERCGQ
jgi:hypothetical protein